MENVDKLNSAVAFQTHEVVVSTDKITKSVVSNANAKEFIGRNEVKAKKLY